jgi:hypothetical protein
VIVAKPAVTAVPIHPLLAERWDSRVFESRAPSTAATMGPGEPS